ncbi:MAG: 3-oxoacyl-ACP synthase [Bdellovibrionales bacterium RBG_16_40_8]|nr:MAG: 3-oxoacyl-ACP synthase [Bdellovibrionales bacterium RBG_16_40_8]
MTKASDQKYRARIAGTGSYLPKKLLSNEDLIKLIENTQTTDAWIHERTGIRNRHVAADDQVTTDLALEAAKIALKESNIKPTDLDAILFATISPDQTMPSASCVLQRKLGARDCMALDLSAACSGFVYSLAVAGDFIANGSYKNILVIGAEILTRFVNYKDRDTCILFGDGAGAFVVTRSSDNEPSKIYSHHLHADGYISDVFELPMGGSAYPFTHENIDKGLHYMNMKGREIFKHAIRTMSQCCGEALEHNKMSGQEIDWVIPHQANVRIVEGVAKHFDISMDKVISIIENMGNTSAATIPIAFDTAIRDGRIKRGHHCLLAAFGAGVTSGSILLRY